MSDDEGGRIRSYRDLVVWQKAVDAAVLVYGVARCFPREEVYGLQAQTTRAAASVAANIAEGQARGSPKEFAHFLSIAKGSVAETETLLEIAIRLTYVGREEARSALVVLDEISRMIAVLRSRIG